MSSLARAGLFIAAVVGLGGAIFFVSRSDPKPARSVSSRAALELVAASAAVATERAPLPPPPAAADAELARPPAAAGSASEIETEAALAASMHALEDSDPARALELARQGQRSWPAGARAPEFAATEVKCLYRLGKPSEGRGAAEAMVNKYPTSPWALEVEKQTGAHPYVNH